MKKLLVLFALAVTCTASVRANESEMGSAPVEAIGDATMDTSASEAIEGRSIEEFDATLDAQTAPWWYLGCVNSVPMCSRLAWNHGFNRFVVRRDPFRCPPYLAACWGRRF